MHPAFSVIFLTTLIGAGQGLFLALFSSQAFVAMGLIAPQDDYFYAIGSLISILFLSAGLLSSNHWLSQPWFQ